MLSTRNLKYNDTGNLKVRGWMKMYHANTDQKEVGASTLSDNLDLKA